MSPRQFDSWQERSLMEYAENVARAEGVAFDVAFKLAQTQHHEIVPRGFHTPGHYFFAILDLVNRRQMGHLWFAVKGIEGAQKAFLYDILIDPAFQGKGLGRQTMALLEGKVRELGLKSIRLHVFEHNFRAKKLYETMGFQVTNCVMQKNL